MGPLDKSEWKAIVLGWSLRPLGLLLKKSMSTTVVQKKIYILTCPLCIFIIYQFRWGQRQRTHFKKKWKSASLVSVFTTSKKYDRFFKAFSFGTRKKCISWHYFMQFFMQCIFSWNLKNFWILEHIFLKKQYIFFICSTILTTDK